MTILLIWVTDKVFWSPQVPKYCLPCAWNLVLIEVLVEEDAVVVVVFEVVVVVVAVFEVVVVVAAFAVVVVAPVPGKHCE